MSKLDQIYLIRDIYPEASALKDQYEIISSVLAPGEKRTVNGLNIHFENNVVRVTFKHISFVDNSFEIGYLIFKNNDKYVLDRISVDSNNKYWPIDLSSWMRITNHHKLSLDKADLQAKISAL